MVSIRCSTASTAERHDFGTAPDSGERFYSLLDSEYSGTPHAWLVTRLLRPFLFAARQRVQRNDLFVYVTLPEGWFLFAARQRVQRNVVRGRGVMSAAAVSIRCSTASTAELDWLVWCMRARVQFLFAARQRVQRNTSAITIRGWVSSSRFLFAARQRVQRNRRSLKVDGFGLDCFYSLLDSEYSGTTAITVAVATEQLVSIRCSTASTAELHHLRGSDRVMTFLFAARQRVQRNLPGTRQ